MVQKANTLLTVFDRSAAHIPGAVHRDLLTAACEVHNEAIWLAFELAMFWGMTKQANARIEGAYLHKKIPDRMFPQQKEALEILIKSANHIAHYYDKSKERIDLSDTRVFEQKNFQKACEILSRYEQNG